MQYTKYNIEDNEIVFRLDTGGILCAYVEDRYFLMNDVEYDFDDDASMKDTMIMHGKLIYTLGNVAQWCLSNHDTIRDVEKHEAEIDQAMYDELCSVELTGRV